MQARSSTHILKWLNSSKGKSLTTSLVNCRDDVEILIL